MSDKGHVATISCSTVRELAVALRGLIDNISTMDVRYSSIELPGGEQVIGLSVWERVLSDGSKVLDLELLSREKR